MRNKNETSSQSASGPVRRYPMSDNVGYVTSLSKIYRFASNDFSFGMARAG